MIPASTQLLQAHEDAELGVVPGQAALEINRVGRADGAVGGQLDGRCPARTRPAAMMTSES